METRDPTITTTSPQAIPITITITIVGTEATILPETLTLETGITTLAMLTRTGDTDQRTVTQELPCNLMAFVSILTETPDTVINS